MTSYTVSNSFTITGGTLYFGHPVEKVRMIEATSDAWELANFADALVITTNGYIKKNGEAVMGKGIAKEAATRYRELPALLGKLIKEDGHVTHVVNVGGLFQNPRTLVLMPVKPEFGPNGEMGWKAKADIELIKKSIQELVQLADDLKWQTVILPRPGCGNGGLSWINVKPVIAPFLDERFIVVSKG